MARFFADSIANDVAVFETDAQHMAKTLRMKEGDRLDALLGDGRLYACVVESVSPQRVTARVFHTQQAPFEPAAHVTVYQGIPKHGKLETVIQKCVELGAAAITPLLLKRCEVREVSPSRLERYQKIAREAAKQCGRAILPQVGPVCRLEQVFGKHDLLLCPYEMERVTTLKQVLQTRKYQSVGIVIGPEGGLEAEEAARIRAHGGVCVTLGPRILRTETAAPAVLAALMYEWDAWEIEKS